ncbi:MAG TPA: AAA family ATPase, partial [Polyangiaceae bacterium]|nr:AAA family ATPase [Polyangiaceae bacterium]
PPTTTEPADPAPPEPAPAPAPRESLPPRPWSDAFEPAGSARDAFRVRPEEVQLHTDPALLPEEPRSSGGLFEIVGSVTRRALALGIAAREPSFHVFVAAEPEVMIEDDVVRFAERFAAARPRPPDIVYVHDFQRPEAPRPLCLPAGEGKTLVAAMEELLDGLRADIVEITDSDELQAAQAGLGRELEAKNREILAGLESRAKTLGFGIRAVPGGVQTFPILHGKPVSPEQFGAFDEPTKRALGEAEERLTSEVAKAAQRVRSESARFDAARAEALGETVAALVAARLAAMREALAPAGEGVVAYLADVEKALSEDWEDLVSEDDRESGGPGPGGDEESGRGKDGRDHDPEHATRLNRFRVNLLVASDAASVGAPVVYETNPTYPNLFGYLERRARFGALLTDFTRIRAGSLHRASGGVLVVRAADLMTDPIIWERVKRVLRERRVGAEDPLGPLGLYATTLRPVPVPIAVRVILVGPPGLYAALLEADADFAALFRVKVEVEPSIPRTDDALVRLDAYLMAMAKERGWGAFDRAARARLLDLATRLSGDRERLSLTLAPLEETAAFASALGHARELGLDEAPSSMPPSRVAAPPPEKPAKPADKSAKPADKQVKGAKGTEPASDPASSPVTTVEDIDAAWRDRRERLGSAERHIRELTLRGEVALDTDGWRVGVVNGLSVFSAGDVEFGQPMRITAVVALGREGIIDVEREAQLGGSIHTKGVAILRGYLGKMFGQERPLSVRAQLAFEQSYGEVDGDSASSTELYSLLSALSDIPIDQSVAVTGSVNQLGEVQAIGGVCAKIEGFFDLCHARGLTGRQGVLLPRANLPHLVLRQDVVAAVAAGQFHLHAVATVSEGIEVLTGVPAGARDPSGRFPAGSVFGRVERRIIEIAERLRQAEATGRVPSPAPSMDDVSSVDLGGDELDFRGGR